MRRQTASTTRMLRVITVLSIAVLCMLLSACMETGAAVFEAPDTPAPSLPPTPTPEPFSVSVTAEPLPTDALGQIVESDGHYYDYISYGDIRIYEYDTGTFLDGICFSSYPEPLDGTVRILFRDKDGRMCGEGTLHNALGTTVMQPGANTIYAEILTDISVLEMDFTLEVERQFAPSVRVE
ncbi:MAG: hypothetical protein IJK14_07450 [Clostridia bacterium]|nr:hypothetical protein [Clostridia bacterium]MBR0445185.1 hypothetical protein [Clostridia bacterium]